MATNPQRSENSDHNLHISLQESIAHMVQNPNQITNHTVVRHGLQSFSFLDVTHSHDIPSSNSRNNPTPMEIEEYSQTEIRGQSVSHDGVAVSNYGISGARLERSEICIGGSSFSRPAQFQFGEISSQNASATFPGDSMSPQPRRPGGNHADQHQQTTYSEPSRRQSVYQQQNRHDDLPSIIGHVKSPFYAGLATRINTFLNWPMNMSQTPNHVAEAGFYYTGFLDTVRCFACDGGLKNWDPEDDPWIEHTRWFPQCPYVRHIKGEEFINLVRIASEESDEDDDLAVHRGAAWKGADNQVANRDSVLNEIKEQSVLETKDAKIVIEMGFEKKDVAMAINGILKKGKQDFTPEEILDMMGNDKSGKLSDYKLSVDSPSCQEILSDTEQVMSENKHLKELLQCTECKVKERNVLFLPCTHHLVCESCSANLEICTKCYRRIKEKVRTFMS